MGRRKCIDWWWKWRHSRHRRRHLEFESESNGLGNTGRRSPRNCQWKLYGRWRSVGSAFTLPASSNPTLLSDVQAWFGDATSNHGWELINSGEGTSQSVKSFSSREAAAGIRPLLTITYVPEGDSHD